jgi:hypothetical protein
MITALGETCSDARGFHRAMAANTGWSIDDYKTLVLFYPLTHMVGRVGPVSIPLLLNYDLIGTSPQNEAWLARGTAPPPPPSSPQAALSDISGWTGLTISRVGALLGVARRSLYNWIEGRPISTDMQHRVQSVHSVVARVAAQYDPPATRAWLEAGEPSNFELLRDQQWALISKRLPQTGLPRATRVDESLPTDEGTDPSLPADARSALLALFASAGRSSPDQPGDSWVPQELTGAIPFEEDDEDD